MKLVDYVHDILGKMQPGNQRGSAGRPYLSDRQKAILARLAKGPSCPGAIASELGLLRRPTQITMWRLKRRGIIKMTSTTANGQKRKPPCIWELVE